MELYTYRALVTEVYDADTITVDINLGFGIKFTDQKLRLAAINAPELRGEEREAGLVSRDALREKILGKEVLIKTEKDKTEKYGRYIAFIFLPFENINENEGEAGLTNINDWLVENKYAEYHQY